MYHFFWNMLLSTLTFLTILPTYLCADLTYTIQEGKDMETYIGDIAADSKIMDGVPFKDQELIRFSLLQQDVTEEPWLFKVSRETGKLYTAEILDAEELCKYNKECFRVLDVAIQKGASSIKILEIKVIIKDVNDHPPGFPDEHITITFEENVIPGTIILIPNAVDKDVGFVNSNITYRLKKNKDEPFSLVVSPKIDGTSKLGIKLKERLDREVRSSYLIQVIAKDGGSPPKESILHVSIIVTDINDNAPVFTQNVYNVSIKNEPSETIPVTILSATDLDSNSNGKVCYHLSSKTADIVKTHFKIDRNNGKIFLYHKLMTGQEIKYKLYVEAMDRGASPLSSTALVVINVIDHTNNVPLIKINFVSTSSENGPSISEDVKVGSFIAYVKVIDNDEGQNGDVTCHLHHDKFQLQNLGTKKYEVTLKNPLDREKQEHHDVVISCQDKGSPPLHSNSKFSIQVMDINDVRPQFTKDTFKFFIDENQNSRITLGYINATDPDLGDGGKLTYSLITNNNKHFLPFKITTNGLLSAIMSLDHEFQHTYHFKVFVKDNGTPSLNNTVNVIVEVTDKNDNAPYFTFPSVKPYNLHVTYYPDARNKNITQIKAADSDSQENAFLKYQIIRGNDKQMFTINQYTGFLAFNRQLSQQNAGSYQLDILVKDSGRPVLSATTTLFLTLTISNNTSEMLNVVQLHTEEKVHLNLVIIITVIAVTIAVFITASLSICIIRCNGQSNVSHTQALDRSNRNASELITPFYQGNYCPHSAQPVSLNCHHSAQPVSLNSTLPTNIPSTSKREQLKVGRKLQEPSGITSQDTTRYLAWISATSSPDQNRFHTEGTDISSSKLSAEGKLPNEKNSSSSIPHSRNHSEMNKVHNSFTRPLPPLPCIDN